MIIHLPGEVYNLLSLCMLLVLYLNIYLQVIHILFCVCRYLYLSNLVTTPGASGAFLRLVIDQVSIIQHLILE